jgi:hypothetical protein
MSNQAMTDWQTQNENQWRKIAFLLQGETSSGVIWITYDQYQHGQYLLQQLQNRFPNYQHTFGNVDKFPGGWLSAYFEDVFIQSGGGAVTDRPQMFHVSGLESYLPCISDKAKARFFDALNWERPLFYQDLPFLLVFCTDSHTLIETHRLAIDFWEWLSMKFHFEAPPTQASHDMILPS